MKKYTILTLIGAMLLFGCTDNDVELPIESSGTSTVDVQITSVGFANNSTTGRSARTSNSSNNITWNHIFGGTASITFTNTSTVTPIDSTYTIDMADFAVNGLSKTLINGDYDVVLTMTDNTPEDYVPVNATDSFTLSADTGLVLDATTTYGMVLLDPYLVDTNVIPIFSESGTDHDLQQDQGYYYLYIPDGVTGTITLKESLFGQTVSKDITIESRTIDALELVPVTSNAGISLQLEEFAVVYDEWDIDAPVNGITPSYGIFTDSGQVLTSNSSVDIELGDLDGDGDLDAFVVNWGQSNKVWLNDGSGVFSDSGQSLGNFKSESVALGDLDGDGDLDAFVSNNNEPSKVWLNNGSGSFADSGQNIQDIPRGGVDVSLGDLDGDGDLDAVVINHNTVDKIWLNDGNGIFSDSGQTLTNSDSIKVNFADLDNDGDLDIFVTNTNYNASKVWVNDGNGNFSDSGQNIGSTRSMDVVLRDLDGDGDLDVYEVNFSDPDQVWFNDGNGNFSNSGQSLGNTYGIAVDVADLDGDGDLDAFTVNTHTDSNSVLINN